jgi:uncharacterized protein (TIGR02996 family)
MPSEADLLAAIDASPEDDAPRLAHADWLARHGQRPRARYIRLQVSIARSPRAFPRREDEVEADQLIRQHRASWTADLPKVAGMEWGFERGYPEQAVFTSRTAFEKSWRQVLVPGIRRVTFLDVINLGRVASSPGLARVRELEIAQLFLSDEVLLELLASPHLAGLRGLHVIRGRATGASLRAAARLPALERLTFNSSIPQPLAAAAVRAVAGMACLRALTLEGWRMADSAARALWAGNFPALTELRLRDCGIRAGGMEGLGDGSCLPLLEVLDLGNNALGDGGAEALARATRWSRLRSLDLHTNLIGARGAAALAGAAHLAWLEALSLRWNAVPDEGAKALARWSLPALRLLDLGHNLIGDAGMRALAGPGVLPALEELDAQDNPARVALIEAAEKRTAPPPEEVRPAAVAAAVEVRGAADEDGLVRALLAAPWDDLARAAYADWLEEQGKPLHAALMRRAHDSLEPVEWAVAGPIHNEFPNGVMAVDLEGGLLTVRLRMRMFLTKAFEAVGPSWLRQHHIARLALTGRASDWARVGGSPVLAHARAFSLVGCQVGNAGAEALARSPGLAGLAGLSLRNAEFGEPGVKAVARSKALAGVVALDLAQLLVSANGLRALADGPLAGGLRYLSLAWNHLWAAEVAVVAQSPNLSGLVTLDLSVCRLDDTALLALANSPHLAQLRGLDLSGNRFTDAGADALAGSALLGRLRWLSLREGPGLSADARLRLVRAVAAVPGCRLVLSGQDLPDGVAEKMRGALGARLKLVG